MKVNKQTAGSVPSLAQIVAGLSHHLNNPLAAILGYSELLLRRDLDESAKGMLELIHQQADRCKQTLQSLNEMIRRPAQGFRVVDLGSLAQECVAMKTAEFAARQVRVQLDFPAPVSAPQADPIALQQVFCYLFENALQSMEGQTKDKTLSISGGNSKGWAMVRVKDSGTGIKPDVLPQIFEPFFTTKAKEENAGLGLTLSLAIMHEHDGRIEVESTEEEGTCVTLFLPDKARHTSTSSTTSEILAGKHILVAEDEPALAQLLGSLLSPMNAAVVHVNDGIEALEAAQRGQWDLIISDIQMPGMTGIELFQRLASTNPDLAKRMILITGSTRALPQSLLPGANPLFLYKPFSRSELIGAISRAFHERPAEHDSP